MRRQQAGVSVPYSVATRLRSQRHRLSVVARTTSAATASVTTYNSETFGPLLATTALGRMAKLPAQNGSIALVLVFLTTALARALARLMLPGPPPAAASAPRETAALGGAGP